MSYVQYFQDSIRIYNSGEDWRRNKMVKNDNHINSWKLQKYPSHKLS